MNQIPIRIDPQAEDEYRDSIPWHRRFVKWLSRHSPLLIYYEIPYGRVSLEMQLKYRTRFPGQTWESRGFTVDQAEAVLGVIAKELNLPNNYLIPDDPLHIALVSDYDDFPLSSLRHALRNVLEAEFGLDELASLVTDDTITIESFVREILQRRLRPVH